jgi:hypothetical protein
VFVAFDHARAEPTFEEMSPAAVSRVEQLRVPAVEESHPIGDVSPRRLHDQVEMRRHQAVDVANPPVAKDRPTKDSLEDRAVLVVDE